NPVLVKQRQAVRRKVRLDNQTTELEEKKRKALLKYMFGSNGENILIEPNLRFDYGYNTYIGENFYANFDCIFLDVCEIRIGNDCMYGKRIQILNDKHQLQSHE